MSWDPHSYPPKGHYQTVEKELCQVTRFDPEFPGDTTHLLKWTARSMEGSTPVQWAECLNVCVSPNSYVTVSGGGALGGDDGSMRS